MTSLSDNTGKMLDQSSPLHLVDDPSIWLKGSKIVQINHILRVCRAGKAMNLAMIELGFFLLYQRSGVDKNSGGQRIIRRVGPALALA